MASGNAARWLRRLLKVSYCFHYGRGRAQQVNAELILHRRWRQLNRNLVFPHYCNWSTEAHWRSPSTAALQINRWHEFINTARVAYQTCSSARKLQTTTTCQTNIFLHELLHDWQCCTKDHSPFWCCSLGNTKGIRLVKSSAATITTSLLLETGPTRSGSEKMGWLNKNCTCVDTAQKTYQYPISAVR